MSITLNVNASQLHFGSSRRPSWVFIQLSSLVHFSIYTKGVLTAGELSLWNRASKWLPLSVCGLEKRASVFLEWIIKGTLWGIFKSKGFCKWDECLQKRVSLAARSVVGGTLRFVSAAPKSPIIYYRGQIVARLLALKNWCARSHCWFYFGNYSTVQRPRQR